MSELILVKRNNEYRVQSKDLITEGLEIISHMDVPMQMVHSLMRRITGREDGYFYLSSPTIDDTNARYMFKDVLSNMLGIRP